MFCLSPDTIPLNSKWQSHCHRGKWIAVVFIWRAIKTWSSEVWWHLADPSSGAGTQWRMSETRLQGSQRSRGLNPEDGNMLHARSSAHVQKTDKTHRGTSLLQTDLCALTEKADVSMLSGESCYTVGATAINEKFTHQSILMLKVWKIFKYNDLTLKCLCMVLIPLAAVFYHTTM